MCIKIVHVSSMQKKSYPQFAVSRLLYVNTMNRHLKKKNAGRKWTSTSYAMENANNKPVGTLRRANVCFANRLFCRQKTLTTHKYIQVFRNYC